MPRDAPVTRAVFPERLFMMRSPLLSRMSSRVSNSLGQEHRHVTHKEFGILVLRPMIGIWVQDQLGVGDVLLQDEGIHRVDEHIVAAVHHKRRLTDLLQIFIGIFAWSTPPVERLELRWCNVLIHLRIATVSAQTKSLQIFMARRLTPLRGREECAKP